jgi:hypothetical protein
MGKIYVFFIEFCIKDDLFARFKAKQQFIYCDYHKKVQDTIGPLIKDDPLASRWLSSRTVSIETVNSGSVLTYRAITISVLIVVSSIMF